MIFLLLIFCSSLALSAFVVPALIQVAIKKRLFDIPIESRKVHKKIIPNLGGVAIFSGFMFTQQLFIQNSIIPALNQVLMCGSILFMLGLKDDIIGLSPFKKFIGQFASAFIIVIIGDIRIMNLQGVFSFEELNYTFSLSLTIFVVVGIINAFNLIDGVDGLAGLLGLIMSLTFAYLFYNANETDWSYLATSLAGAIGGFLIFNIPPARIFMGDSGSLMLGFFAAIMGIHFVNIAGQKSINLGFTVVSSSIGLILSLLIIPIFDTARVFILRILNNSSPFKADRNHLHHRLLSIGFSHLQVTASLSAITILFIFTALFLQDIGNNQLIATIIIIIIMLNLGLALFSGFTNPSGSTISTSVKNLSQEVSTVKPIINEDFVKEISDNIYKN
jgi:UDP-GlcNAc:undecaprenyl-phosphate GlcNAc-1-phosphate transferase